MPFAYPMCMFSYADTLTPIVTELNENSSLCVVCIQECWSFRAGFLKPLLTRAATVSGMHSIYAQCNTHTQRLLRAFEWTAYTAVIAAGLLCIPLECFIPSEFFVFDPKTIFVDLLGLRYASNVKQCPRLLDSGLLTVTNQPIIADGFECYEDVTRVTEEFLAVKGVQWTVIAMSSAKACIVLNTHGQCASALFPDIGSNSTRFNKMRIAIRSCLTKSINCAKQHKMTEFEFCVAGDFNVDVMSAEFQMLAQAVKPCVRLQQDGFTMPTETQTIDHIFTTLPLSLRYSTSSRSDHVLLSATG